MKGGAPPLGLTEASEGVGSQGVSPPTSWRGPGCGALADRATPRSGTLSRSPARQPRSPDCWSRESSCSVWVSLPAFLVGQQPPAPGPPLGSLAAPRCMLSLSGAWAQVRPVAAGLPRPPAQVPFGGVGPTVSLTQFYSVPSLPVSLLQAWEGSGDASFCSDARTIWP